MFGEFCLKTDIRELQNNGEPVAIEPKVFDILEFLIRNSDRVVPKDELIAVVWDGRIISDGALSTGISTLRRVLGDNGQQQKYIKTAHGRGFRFVGAFSGTPAQAAPSQTIPDTAEYRTNIKVRNPVLIGRERECEALEALVKPGSVVSIVGPGGAGKSSLARLIAARSQGVFQGGAWFCEFAPVHADQLESTVLGSIDSSAGAGRVDAFVIAERIGPDPALLVFDNCEHVVDEAAKLADELHQQLPNLSILTTTREALELRSEQRFRLAGLGYQDDAHEAEEFFHHCAKRFVDLPRTEETNGIVRDIVERLEGLPLAIELAAPRLISSSPSELLRALDDQLSILSVRRGSGDARHKTMDRTIAWSFDLLSDAERRTLTSLSIFSGAFTVQAAEAVCDDSDARAIIHDLVGQSMVAFVSDSPASRFRLLEPIRQFAERQVAPAEQANLAERHAIWFAGRTGELAVQMRGGGEIEACKALTAEWPDLGRALSWGRRQQRADVAVTPLVELGIQMLWQLRIEGFGWLEEGVEACTLSREAQARADLARAMGAWSAGDLDRSEALMEAAIEAGGETVQTAYFQFYQSFAREDFASVVSAGQKAWKWAAETDEIHWHIATSAFLVCGYAMHRGDTPEIEELFADVERMLASYPWPSGRCCELIARVVAAFGRGDAENFETYRETLSRAADACYAPWFKVTAAGMQSSKIEGKDDAMSRLAMYAVNLREAITSGDVIQLPTILRASAICLADAGEFETAARLSGLIPSVRGLGEKGSLAPDYDRAVFDVQKHLGDERFLELQALGQSWTLSDAIEVIEKLLPGETAS